MNTPLTRLAHVSVLDLVMPLLGLYAGQYLIGAIAKVPGWGLAVIGVSLALLVLRLRPGTSKGLADAMQTFLGLLLVLPLALNAGGWKEWTPGWQLILVWLLGCLLVIAAVFKLKPQPIKLGLAKVPRLDWRDWLAMALLVGAALLLRVPNIETVPMGVDPDEASLAQMAVDVITGENKDPFATGWATHPTLEFFINSVFVRLFGRSFLAMRLPWAIIGSLAVATIYLLAWAGYGRRVAIVAGALMAGSSVAIQFGRLGLNNVGDTLFVTWVLAALWIAGATGSPRAYAMAGVGLGLAQYYYFGTRAIPFVVLATLLVWLIADWRGVLRAWYLLLGGALVALAVVGPLAGHWLLHPNAISEHLFLTLPFSTYLDQESARKHLPVALIIWRRVRDSLLIFTMTRDNGSFYTARQPMLNSLQAPFFLIGVLALFANWRRTINQGMVVWVAVILTLGSVLITDVATYHRILSVLPAGILIAAIGIDASVTVLAHAARGESQESASDAEGNSEPPTPPRGRGPATGNLVALVLAVVVVAALVTADVYHYFRVYTVTHPYKPPVQEAVSIAALEYEHLKGEGQFVLYTHEGVDPTTGKIYHAPIVYVAGEAFLGGVPANLGRLDPARPLYFYVLPDRAAELPLLKERFPGGAEKQYYRSSDGLLLMTRYAVGGG